MMHVQIGPGFANYVERTSLVRKLALHGCEFFCLSFAVAPETFDFRGI